jgi:hypothetical protein
MAVRIRDESRFETQEELESLLLEGLASGSSELGDNEFGELRAELARRIAHREQESSPTMRKESN